VQAAGGLSSRRAFCAPIFKNAATYYEPCI
jgi:hypothetical protein